MASACVNNIAFPPENTFFDCPPATFPSYGWLSPRISFSRDADDSNIFSAASKPLSTAKSSDPTVTGKGSLGDFEFCLENPVAMLPADELFSDGKLVPLHLPSSRPAPTAVADKEEIEPTEEARKSFRMSEDPHIFSPKAPRCSRRWRELLGLKKLGGGGSKLETSGCSSPSVGKASPSSSSLMTSSAAPSSSSSSSSSSSYIGSSGKSIRHFLHRTSKSSSTSSDSTLSLPLLRDSSDCESVSISSRLSLSSSSSSGYDYDDLPRHSLDAGMESRLSHHQSVLSRSSTTNHPRVRMVKPRMVVPGENNQKSLIDHPSAPTRVGRSPNRRYGQPDEASVVSTRGFSVDSPRMNSSGKIVFQSLERSSSSPSTFNGGPRYKHRAGVERSYSANVRITPVLNVPVCSLRGSSKSGGGGVFGFGQFFSSSSSQFQKKDGNGNLGGSKTHQYRHNVTSIRSRKD